VMPLRKSQIYLLAFSSAVITANLYYSQPLLAYWADTFQVSESSAGQTFFYSMLGQALGLIALIPLGDKLKRKKFLLWIIAAAMLAIIAAALSVNLVMLKAAMFVSGFFSVGPQIIIPLTVDLSPQKERTHVVGVITSGILTGTVFARLFSGSITVWMNWQMVYVFSALFTVIIFFLIRRYIPESRSDFKGSYKKILQSVWQLFKKYSEIRVAVIVSSCSFVVSRMFWATVAFLLAGHLFNLTTDLIGIFGLVTLTGSLSAPLAGKLEAHFSDKKVIVFGMLTLVTSFVVLYFFSSVLIFVVVGGALMEGSRQLVQVTMQSQTIGLVKEARSRLNMLYISGCFIGAALGAALGLAAWHWNGWEGVCVVAFVILAIQMLVYFQSLRNTF